MYSTHLGYTERTPGSVGIPTIAQAAGMRRSAAIDRTTETDGIPVTKRAPEPTAITAREPSDTARAAPDAPPGALRGGATLTLQTRQAQRLIRGRGAGAERPAIIGLFGFAHLLRPIWQGARMDDPYADWWMLKIDEALAAALQQLEAAQQRVAAQLETLGALEIALPGSVKPTRIALNFSNPYAFRGAQLISRYDTLVCTTLGARHVGLLTAAEAERLLQVSGRPIRRAFQTPLGYRLTGVTRDDVAQGTATADAARTAMGELPAEVQSGARRAPHAPARSLPLPGGGAPGLRLRSLPAADGRRDPSVEIGDGACAD